MGYRNRPFNPLAPTPNQVITELNHANENFDILAQAFLSNNPETFIVKNADKVDGFHASTTPTPNTIPVAGADGKIALGWLPDDVFGGGGFKSIDLTSATSDYELQPGEEAVYHLQVVHNVSFPLKISVVGGLYELFIVSFENFENKGAYPVLYPNNMAYNTTSSSLYPFRLTMHSIDGLYGRFFYRWSSSNVLHFGLDGQGYMRLLHAYINTAFGRYSVFFKRLDYLDEFPSLYYGGFVWVNAPAWTSLGTILPLSVSNSNDEWRIIVRRLS